MLKMLSAQPFVVNLHVNSSTVLYAIFDGEVKANNGYIETETLIKALVTPDDNTDGDNTGDHNTNGDSTQTETTNNIDKELLSAEYIDMYELQELSGNDSLWFGTMASSYENYYSGKGNLVYGFYTSGIVSEELLFIYDMPEEFAQEYNNEGTYNGIRFCIVQGMWCFNPQDLISVGLLNADGSFNEEFESQTFDESKAKKERESDWISDSQLESIYDYSWTWMGETAYLSNYYLNTKYTITGTPASSFGNDVVHSCSCNGFTVRIKYLNGDYLFFYYDLVKAGIVN